MGSSFLGINLVALIETIGYIGMFGIVFAESGLLIGFFLPGDSLLFTAGFLASQGYLNIVILMAVTFAGAVLGDNIGYAFGRRTGPNIFKREGSLLFNPENLKRARRFYEKHGGKMLVLARFAPVIRTFAPILAGVGNMHYKTFFFYNVLGAVLWGIGITGLGYFLGNTVPNIEHYIVPALVVIIGASLIPGIIHLIRSPQRRRQITGLFSRKANG